MGSKIQEIHNVQRYKKPYTYRQIVYNTPSTYYKHSIKRDLHSPLKEEERNTIKELSNRR